MINPSEAYEIKRKVTSLIDHYINLHNSHEKLKKELEAEKSKNTDTQSLLTNKKDKNAIIFLAADISGSMGIWERNTGLMFVNIIKNVLKEKYKNVTLRYFHYNVEAKEVVVEDFLQKSDSGGTITSFVYKLMNKELEDYDYDDENMDTFIVHISDGENLSSDFSRLEKIVDRVSKKVNKIVYFEVNQYNRKEVLSEQLKVINNNRMIIKRIQSEEYTHIIANDVLKELLK